MSEPVFSGKFLKPAETFVVQHFDHVDLNRLAFDLFFWTVVIVAALLAIHFVLVALPDLRRKRGQSTQAGTLLPDAQVRRRDAAQIAYHWVNALSLIALLVSGLGIYFGWSNTAAYFAWHLWMAWIFIGALAFHIWYATIRVKHFHRMWTTRQDLRDALSRVRPGASAVEERPKHAFYKVEQIAFHWVLTALVLGLVVTGFVLWNPGRMFIGPFWMPWGWDAVFVARVLHDAFTFILLAFIIAHIYFALIPENWNVLKSIVTGRVRFSEYAKEHRVSPQVAARIEALQAGREQEVPVKHMESIQKG